MSERHEEAKCSICRFYKGGTKAGECRRNPPAVAWAGDDLIARNPGVKSSDWCGEFQDKQPDRPVGILNLGVRARRCLEREGIKTIKQLQRMTDRDLLEIEGFGPTCLVDLKRKLNRLAKIQGE